VNGATADIINYDLENIRTHLGQKKKRKVTVARKKHQRTGNLTQKRSEEQ